MKVIKRVLGVLAGVWLLRQLVFAVDHVFTPALALLSLSGNLDDNRIELLMTNTTADTEVDAENPADFGTHDEFDGANYAVDDPGSEAMNVDLANDRAEFDHADALFSTLGNGTRQIQGWLEKHNVDGTDANDLNKFYQDFSGTINPGGASLTITYDAEGVVQIANA